MYKTLKNNRTDSKTRQSSHIYGQSHIKRYITSCALDTTEEGYRSSHTDPTALPRSLILPIPGKHLILIRRIRMCHTEILIFNCSCHDEGHTRICDAKRKGQRCEEITFSPSNQQVCNDYEHGRLRAQGVEALSEEQMHLVEEIMSVNFGVYSLVNCPCLRCLIPGFKGVLSRCTGYEEKAIERRTGSKIVHCCQPLSAVFIEWYR